MKTKLQLDREQMIELDKQTRNDAMACARRMKRDGFFDGMAFAVKLARDANRGLVHRRLQGRIF